MGPSLRWSDGVVVCAALCSAPASTQTPIRICGLADGTVAALHAAAVADPRFKRDGGDAMRESYSSESLQAIWSFTTDKNPVHPAALCEQVVDREGSMQIDRQARCEADAAKCAAFQAEVQSRNDGPGGGE